MPVQAPPHLERKTLPGLIICDYRLRDNEIGSAVIERLRNEYSDSIPGMLITGDTARDRIKEAQASGYLLLHKPVANEVLHAAHCAPDADAASRGSGCPGDLSETGRQNPRRPGYPLGYCHGGRVHELEQAGV